MAKSSATQSAAVQRLVGGFDQKVAIVTGGTKGMGEDMVVLFASLGAGVVTCSRTQTDIDALLERLRAKGLERVKAIVADVATDDGRKIFLEKAGSLKDGRLDILVNNAGILDMGATVDFPLNRFRKVISVNMEAVYALTQAAYPLLKKSGSASVIHISSMGGGPLAVLSCPAYSLSKAAIDQFTRVLAIEWGKDGITCNAIKPGFTVTDMTRAALAGEYGKRAIERSPVPRHGKVEDISGLSVFLASPAARFITGQLITVDGGYTVYGNPFPLNLEA